MASASWVLISGWKAISGIPGTNWQVPQDAPNRTTTPSQGLRWPCGTPVDDPTAAGRRGMTGDGRARGQIGVYGVYAACLMAFNGLLAPALKRVRLQFVQYFFYRLVSLEQEKQSCMACMVRFGLLLPQHVRTRFESIRIYDCAVKLQCAFRPPKKVRTRQHK